MSIFSKYLDKPTKKRNPNTIFPIGYLPSPEEPVYPAVRLAFKANKAWEDGEKDLAIDCLSEAIIIWPDNPNYYYIKGEYLFSMDRFDSALINFEEYLSYGEENELVYEKLGHCFWKLNNFQSAIQSYSAAIEIIESQRGKEEFELINKIPINDVVARFYNNRANARLSKGTHAELNLGAKDCIRSLRYAPKYSTALCTLGLLAERAHAAISIPYDNHLLRDAIHYFEQAIELENPKAILLLQELYQKYNLG